MIFTNYIEKSSCS